MLKKITKTYRVHRSALPVGVDGVCVVLAGAGSAGSDEDASGAGDGSGGSRLLVQRGV